MGSPIYSADVPSTLKAVIECASVVSDSNPGMFRHKVCGTVAVAGRGGAMNVIDTLHHFLLNKKYRVGSTYWDITYGLSIKGKQASKSATFSLKLLFGETDARKYLP